MAKLIKPSLSKPLKYWDSLLHLVTSAPFARIQNTALRGNAAGAPKPASRTNKVLAREILNIYRHLHIDLGMNFPISNTFVEFFEEATSKPFPDWANAMRNQALFDGVTTEEATE
jgi:hypothetical protein